MDTSILPGCSDSTTTEPEGRTPDWLSAAGVDYQTPEGDLLTGRQVGEDTFEFKLEAPNGEYFAFQLSPDHLEEWTSQDRLRIEYGEDTGEATYTINGKNYTREHAEIPAWGGMARAQYQDDEFPMGIPIAGLTVYNNKLGNRLSDMIDELARDLDDPNGPHQQVCQ